MSSRCFASNRTRFLSMSRSAALANLGPSDESGIPPNLAPGAPCFSDSSGPVTANMKVQRTNLRQRFGSAAPKRRHCLAQMKQKREISVVAALSLRPSD